MTPCIVPIIAVFLPLVCLLWLFRKISGLYPWEICRSPADLLMLPMAGAYLLMLVGGAWLEGLVRIFASVVFPEQGRPLPPFPPHSPAGPSLCR